MFLTNTLSTDFTCFRIVLDELSSVICLLLCLSCVIILFNTYRLRQRDAAGLVTSPIKTKARAVAKRGALIPAHGLIKSSHRTTKKRKKHVDNTWKKENGTALTHSAVVTQVSCTILCRSTPAGGHAAQGDELG